VVIRTRFLAVVLAVAGVAAVQSQGNQAANELLWEAARAGDTARITAALNQGADVNARSRYDVTALIFAAGSGRLDAVKLLVARGADVNARRTAIARAPTPCRTFARVVIYLLKRRRRG
jgi:hypothetical protein